MTRLSWIWKPEGIGRISDGIPFSATRPAQARTLWSVPSGAVTSPSTA